jgi:hypothetical protein
MQPTMHLAAETATEYSASTSETMQILMEAPRFPVIDFLVPTYRRKKALGEHHAAISKQKRTLLDCALGPASCHLGCLPMRDFFIGVKGSVSHKYV